MSQHDQTISLPGHLWDALDTMSKEMGVPRDGLVSQAVFAFARQNGYVVPGKVEASAAPAQATQAMKPVSQAVMPKVTSAAVPAPTPNLPNRFRRKRYLRLPPRAPSLRCPRLRRLTKTKIHSTTCPLRKKRTRFLKKPMHRALLTTNRSKTKTNFLKKTIQKIQARPKPNAAPSWSSLPGREPFVMEGDTATIGRGKHCDFIIESNRVSREHARFAREGNDFTIEDLNSSNGTFFGASKERVTRRKIKDGDEFTFGTEKVKFTIKK